MDFVRFTAKNSNYCPDYR